MNLCTEIRETGRHGFKQNHGIRGKKKNVNDNSFGLWISVKRDTFVRKEKNEKI